MRRIRLSSHADNVMGMESPDNRRKADDSYQASTRGAGRSFLLPTTRSRFTNTGTDSTMQTLQTYLIVFVGAGLGGSLRHGVNRIALAVGSSFPWNTVAINITGCLVMGLTAGWFAFRGEASQGMRLFLTTGILGGYTTFSAFSLDAALLWERGQERAAVAYVVVSVIASLIGVATGLAVMRR